MKRIIKSFFFFSFLLFGISVFASTSQKTFLETISQEKITIENMFDSSYNKVYQNFQTSVGGFLTSLNYQGLVCLGVISDTSLLQQMQNDNKNLKIGFLNAYATFYADALDIEQKQRIYQDTKVSLFPNGKTYETEKTRILTSLNQLILNQKNLATQFQSSYENKIEKFVKDVKDYSEINKDLLVTIGNNIQTIKNIDEQYKKLNSDLLNYQIQLAGSGNKFFSKLYVLKKASLSGLDSTFQTIINNEVKRNKILPSLGLELHQQKIYALGLYEMQFDEKMNMLLNKWYDNKEFTQITKNIQLFSSTYAPLGKVQCSSFVSSTGFLKELATITNQIKNFSKTVSLQNSGTINSVQFKDAITKWIPLIIQLQKDITSTFKNAVIQKKQVLLNDYKKQLLPTSDQTTLVETPSIIVDQGFKFTQAFKKGQSHNDITILQQLLTKLGHYKGIIDGIYSAQTIEALYQYQLSKNLLKGYEKKPQTRGWMGPSTRSELNKDLLQ
ncbi:hypothetical protein P148_SR1C00001G0527 [candidate division SR1 bacterium RAAC1_SR1_1]|nr:hypothetical protein P148_SR1C00001G0527 [candidate division SR1 bacterium RAAC1_SR1_1]